MQSDSNVVDLGILRPGLATKIDQIMDSMNLPIEGRKYVRSAVLEPSRRVQSGIKNVAGSYPSQKVGFTIGFEARTTELCEAYDAEWDEDTVAYFDQAPYLTFRYKGKNGRNVGYQRRPDFVRVYRDRIVIRECKTESEILDRSRDDTNLYSRDSNGKWRCPPAEEAAVALGLIHELVVDTDMSPTRSRNLRALLDYARVDSKFVNTEAADKLGKMLSQRKRISIAAVLQELGGIATIDDIYRSIAMTDVVVNLDEDWIGDHDKCYLYQDTVALHSFQAAELAISTASASSWVQANSVELKTGSEVNWDGQLWTVLNSGVTEVTLTNHNGPHYVQRDHWNQLVRDKRIRSHQGEAKSKSLREAECAEYFKAATPDTLKRALENMKEIQPHLNGTAKGPTTRTQRRKLQNWKRAELTLGNGFIGLLPNFTRCGNRNSRIEPAVLKIVKEQTDLHYSNPKNVSAFSVYIRIKEECKNAGEQHPSYGWYCKYIKCIPKYENKLAREGRRRAYEYEEQVEHSTHRLAHNADYAFQKAYIDHTEVDAETVWSSTSEILGRPWITVIVDDYSADELGYYLTYDPPSYRSVLMAFRNCVERHGRLPESIVVDGGKEFQSVWFEATCAYFNVTIYRRAKSKARFGSRGERLFDTTNSQFLHVLSGNTQLRKYVRQMSPEVDPDNFAIWTFEFLQRMTERYFEYYRNLPHREILMTPYQARVKSIQHMGNRSERRIVYDQDFLISTCPTTNRGTAKVQPGGVKINYLYYYARILRLHIHENLPVRFDPFNMATAYALVDGKWVTLRSRFYAQLKGRSERELIKAREEYKKRRSDVESLRLNDETSFVKFLLEVDKEEAFLLERRKSNEMRRARGEVEQTEEGNVESQHQDHEEQTATDSHRNSSSQNLFDLGDEELEECETN